MLRPPNDKQATFVKNIIDYSGIDLQFTLFEGNVPNALATKVDGQNYILFNKSFLEDADMSSDTYWHTGFILAHEIGHLLYNHDFTATDTATRYRQELAADNFAGYLLYRLGADEEETSLIMKKSILDDGRQSATHPRKNRRFLAVVEGWRKAYIQQFNIPAPPPPDFTVEDRDYVLSFFEDHSIDCDDLLTPSNDGPEFMDGFSPSCTDNDNTLLELFYSPDTLTGVILRLFDTEYQSDPLPNWIIHTNTLVRLDKPIAGYTDSLINTLEIRLFQNPLFNSRQVGEGTFISLNRALQKGQRIKFKLLAMRREGMMPLLYFSYLDFIPSK